MSHRLLILISTAVLILIVLLFVRLHGASGKVPEDVALAGHRLAEVWCKECHEIEGSAIRTENPAPAFTRIANLPSTTELSLKVFLRSNHRSMPNFIIQPSDADEIAQYILSLKRN